MDEFITHVETPIPKTTKLKGGYNMIADMHNTPLHSSPLRTRLTMPLVSLTTDYVLP